MTHTPGRQPPTAPTADTDADLRRAQRHADTIRRFFYLVVLLVALAGQVTGAVHTLHLPPLWVVPAVAALELGGVVVLTNADLRRRLGEHATGSRLLSAATAGWAITFNWLAHPNHLQGAFYAGMSALGYLTWLTHTENQRRDRLRAAGQLPPTAPAYELIAHWIRHPRTTLQARTLARHKPELGLYGSLNAARAQQRRNRRLRAISTVLHRKIRATVDPATADIAVAVYDLDQIAHRLTQQADYDALTAIIAADLTPTRLAAHQPDNSAAAGQHRSPRASDRVQPTPPGGPATGAPTAAPPVHQARAAQTPATAHSDNPASTRKVGTQQNETPTSQGNGLPQPAYQPTNPADAAMYQTWLTSTTTGQQPTGADLARAAGRADDTTGVGRRAARRYREAHLNASSTTARQ